MGNIGYPIVLSNIPDETGGALHGFSNIGGFLRFKLGELDFGASREALEYTDKTKSAIRQRLREAVAVAKERLQAKIDGLPTWLHAADRIRKIQMGDREVHPQISRSLGTTMVKLLEPKWQGKTLSDVHVSLPYNISPILTTTGNPSLDTLKQLLNRDNLYTRSRDFDINTTVVVIDLQGSKRSEITVERESYNPSTPKPHLLAITELLQEFKFQAIKKFMIAVGDTEEVEALKALPFYPFLHIRKLPKPSKDAAGKVIRTAKEKKDKGIIYRFTSSWKTSKGVDPSSIQGKAVALDRSEQPYIIKRWHQEVRVLNKATRNTNHPIYICDKPPKGKNWIGLEEYISQEFDKVGFNAQELMALQDYRVQQHIEYTSGVKTQSVNYNRIIKEMRERYAWYISLKLSEDETKIIGRATRTNQLFTAYPLLKYTWEDSIESIKAIEEYIELKDNAMEAVKKEQKNEQNAY